MNASQIKLVQDSFAKVEPIADKAAEIFYGKLFEADPSLKPLFKGDMTQQGKKLMTMIATAVNGLNNLTAIVPAVEALGKRHVAYGVKDEHYDTVGAALIGTLAAGLGDEFTDEVKAAWVETYTVLATTMKTAAATVEEEVIEEEGLTPAKIKMVQDTFEMVVPIADKAAEIFYSKLFEKDPSLKSLFKGDMKEQGKKLMAMIATAVNGLTNLEAIVGAVQDLGVRHKDYGVKDAHYDTVGAALLETLEAGLGEAFTPQVKGAWTEVYVLLATTMKDAAASAPAVEETTTAKPWWKFWS